MDYKFSFEIEIELIVGKEAFHGEVLVECHFESGSLDGHFFGVPARHVDEETAAGIMAAAYKNGRPYERLVVSAIH